MRVKINLTFCPLQSKFTSLSLAFKTDKLTLTNRLELQQRQRDIAEKNIDDEIKQLKASHEVRVEASMTIMEEPSKLPKSIVFRNVKWPVSKVINSILQNRNNPAACQPFFTKTFNFCISEKELRTKSA